MFVRMVVVANFDEQLRRDGFSRDRVEEFMDEVEPHLQRQAVARRASLMVRLAGRSSIFLRGAREVLSEVRRQSAHAAPPSFQTTTRPPT